MITYVLTAAGVLGEAERQSVKPRAEPLKGHAFAEWVRRHMVKRDGPPDEIVVCSRRAAMELALADHMTTGKHGWVFLTRRCLTVGAWKSGVLRIYRDAQ